MKGMEGIKQIPSIPFIPVKILLPNSVPAIYLAYYNFCGSNRPLRNCYVMENKSPNLDLQIRVSKILSRGFIFSIVWLGGIGSLIAFISGLYAMRIIDKSKEQIGGIKMAWWCMIAGLIGMVTSPLVAFYFR